MSASTETIRNGQSIRLNILPSESVAVSAASGTYNASIVQGAGIGVIATTATSGTYGPYASGIAILLTASAASEIDYAIAVTPVIISDTFVKINAAGTALVNPVTGTSIPLGYSRGRKVAILGNSVVFQGASIPNNSGISSWAANTVKVATNTIVPVNMVLSTPWPHFYYTCTTGGTTGAIEPIWPTAIGGTVTDGTVIWQATATRSDQVVFGFGFWTWAQQLSGQRLDEVYIVGRSGQQSSEIIKYVDTALSLSPDVIFFSSMFENDCWPGVAPVLATIQANWLALVVQMDKCRASGVRVMLQTVLPSGYIDGSAAFTGYVSGTGTKSWNWLNQKISEYATTYPDVVLWDAANVYVDANPANPVWPENTLTYTSPSGTGQQLKKTDGVHPNTAGGWALAKSLASIISANWPSVERFSTANDSYSRAVNPLNYGTGGTAVGGTITGTPANLMSIAAYGTGGAGTVSKVARTDKAGELQRCTYTATAGDNLDYRPSGANEPIGTHFNVGDGVQSFTEITIEANPTLLSQLFNSIQMVSGLPATASSTVSPSSTSQTVGQFIITDTALTIKTVPVPISAGTTAVQMYTKVYSSGAASFAAQFGKMSIERVIVPNMV